MVVLSCCCCQSDMRELRDFTPSFLWLLRDFYLKLEDEFGRTVGCLAGGCNFSSQQQLSSLICVLQTESCTTHDSVWMSVLHMCCASAGANNNSNTAVQHNVSV